MSVPADPRSPVVALVGGPQHRHCFFYADWLALRRSSRYQRFALDHPCGGPRCYLPTDTTYVRDDVHVTDELGTTVPAVTREWRWVPPQQWAHWGREYLTPDEHDEHERRAAA